MGNRISYSLQCAALGALSGLAGVILRQYFIAIDIPPFLPAALRLVAAPFAGGAIGAALGYFSSMMIEKNEERLGRLRTFFSVSLLFDGLLLGLFLQ